MNERIDRENHENMENLILDFKELLDGNFMLVINGKRLLENVKQDVCTIDLDEQSEGIKVKNPWFYLKAFRLARITVGAGHFRELRSDIADLEKGDEKSIYQFVKKYGFAAMETSLVKQFFSELVKKLRDRNNSERPESRRKLNELITSLTHTDKKRRIYEDFLPQEFNRFHEKTLERAKEFYKQAKDFCEDCKGKVSSYSQCKERLECDDLLKHFGGEYDKGDLKEFLRFGHPSKYVEEIVRTKFGLDRSTYWQIINYLEHMDDSLEDTNNRTISPKELFDFLKRVNFLQKRASFF